MSATTLRYYDRIGLLQEVECEILSDNRRQGRITYFVYGACEDIIEGVPFEGTLLAFLCVSYCKITRDCQVSMNDAKVVNVSNEVFAAIQKYDGDYLADAFSVWDCEEQKWADESMTLLRFESQDILIFANGEECGYAEGTIDTNKHLDVKQHLLCWKRDERLSRFVGDSGTSSAGFLIIG